MSFPSHLNVWHIKYKLISLIASRDSLSPPGVTRSTGHCQEAREAGDPDGGGDDRGIHGGLDAVRSLLPVGHIPPVHQTWPQAGFHPRLLFEDSCCLQPDNLRLHEQAGNWEFSCSKRDSALDSGRLVASACMQSLSTLARIKVLLEVWREGKREPCSLSLYAADGGFCRMKRCFSSCCCWVSSWLSLNNACWVNKWNMEPRGYNCPRVALLKNTCATYGMPVRRAVFFLPFTFCSVSLSVINVGGSKIDYMTAANQKTGLCAVLKHTKKAFQIKGLNMWFIYFVIQLV